MSSATSDLYAYEPPESLWELIKQNANECELDDIKTAIGETLIDTSIDLHAEVNTLLDIWRDYREETMDNLNHIIRVNSGKNLLPEPPDMRERLIKEIHFFVKQMREKSDSKAFCNQLTSNKHNLNVINYVLNTVATSPSTFNDESMNLMLNDNETSRLTPKPTQRPVSSMSKTGLETPCMPSTYRALNNCSKMSTTLEVYENKLNTFHIDEVVGHLREILQEENETLLKDIDFLYECIDKESEYRLQSQQTVKEPSLVELKEERKRLEEDILEDGTSNTTYSKLQRPSSNISISSIPLSIKSPSPTPSINNSTLLSRRAVESPTTRKLPLTLNSLNKSGQNSTTELKPRVTLNSKPTASPVSALNNTANKSNVSKMNSSHVSSNHDRIENIKSKLTNTASALNHSTENLKSTTASASSSSSRTNSVSSITRTKVVVPPVVKPNSAEKFRKMVLESRDTS